MLDAADERGGCPFGLARELDGVQAGQQLAEQGNELDPGQRRAQAVMRAEPAQAHPFQQRGGLLVELTLPPLSESISSSSGCPGGEASELTLAHWERVIDVNLRGVLHGVHAAYPVMIAQRSGHIVNTASIAGLVPAPWLTPYAMTKHAVVGLSLSLCAEAAVHGVRVTAVCPGVVDTPMLDTAGPDDLPTTVLSGQVREFFRHVQPRFYAADQLAQDIIRGIDRNAALVIAPASARVAYYLWRYTPFAVNRMKARLLARSRAALPGHETARLT